MDGWVWVVVFNAITAGAYLGIVLFIVRGLRRTEQLGKNRLAVATAAIFLTCAAHHLVHMYHLASASDLHDGHDAGVVTTMRESMGDPLDVAVTASTALAGAVYLGLRRSYGVLWRSPAMFDDASEARYRQLAANLPHTVVFVVDTDLRFILTEGAGLAEAGYDRRLLEGRLLQDTVPPDVFAHLEPYYRGAVEGRASQFDSVSHVTGKVFKVRARPLFDGADRIVGAVVLAEDVTEERAAREELNRARAFRDAVLTASPDVTTVTDVRTGQTTWTSKSLHTLLENSIEGSTPSWPGVEPSTVDSADEQLIEVVSDDVATVRAADRAAALLPDGESHTVRYRVRTPDGDIRWLSRRTTPFRRSSSGEVSEVLSVVREVTDVVEAEQALEEAALHDPLTGLPNRMLLLERIGSAIERGERTGSTAAVLFCDLDGFKRVNDTGGHAAGDAVLVEVARRMRSVLRPSDSIARVGGDEFVLVIDGMHDSETNVEPDANRHVAQRVAERVRAVLDDPITVDGRDHVISVSVGIVLIHRGNTAHDALRDADSAMYRAKLLGKNRVELFDDALRAGALERAHIEGALRAALEFPPRSAAVLSVDYQPVYHLGSGRLVGFEALARLRDDSGAAIAPDRFIPVAEDTGLVTALGAHVLDLSLGALARWRSTVAETGGGVRPTMAVNLSARQAQHVDMCVVVTDLLTRHGLEPSDLVLELTESVLIDSGSSTLRQLSQLRANGVGIAIDDFGTGYASLRYLATLPVSAVKIDRSFTATMTNDPASDSIVRAIVGMARDLRLDCVVEGIETVEQLNSLPEEVHGQGYLLGRPAPKPFDSWSAAGSAR